MTIENWHIVERSTRAHIVSLRAIRGYRGDIEVKHADSRIGEGQYADECKEILGKWAHSSGHVLTSPNAVNIAVHNVFGPDFYAVQV
jgi:hypothetical protein